MERGESKLSITNPETGFTAVTGKRRAVAQAQFDALCDGTAEGFLSMIVVSGLPVMGNQAGEDGAHATGLTLLNGLPVAAVIRAIVDQYDLSITDVVHILEHTRTSGTITEH